jgi:hypothetical protein
MRQGISPPRAGIVLTQIVTTSPSAKTNCRDPTEGRGSGQEENSPSANYVLSSDMRRLRRAPHGAGERSNTMRARSSKIAEFRAFLDSDDDQG